MKRYIGGVVLKAMSGFEVDPGCRFVFIALIRSFLGKVVNRVKRPPLPVMTEAMGAMTSISTNVRDLFQKNFYVLSKEDEINRFRDPRGYDLVDDVYYIRHPKKAMTDCLVPANEFPRYIMREQIADIISYVRANVNVRELAVSIGRSDTGSVNVGAVLDGLSLEGKAHIKAENVHTAKIEVSSPLKPSEKRLNYVWIDDFPSTRAIVDQASHGEFEIHESFDAGFGIGIKQAQVLGIGAEWMQRHEYRFTVTAD